MSLCGRISQLFDRMRAGSGVTQAICLMFHRVRDSAECLYPYEKLNAINPQEFERIIAHIASQWYPIGIDQLFQHLDRKQPFHNRSVVITFDDGFRDNYEIALPVLQKYDVPATFFIGVGLINGDAPPIEQQLANLLNTNVMLRGPVLGDNHDWDISSIEHKLDAYDRLYEAVKCLPQTIQHETIRLLHERQQHAGKAEDQAMTWEMVQAMDRTRGMTIGSHGYAHHRLPLLERDILEQDLASASRELKDRLGHDIEYLAYPYGETSVMVREAAEKVGIRRAMITGDAPVVLCDVNGYRVPRINIQSIDHLDQMTFEQVLSRFACRK